MGPPFDHYDYDDNDLEFGDQDLDFGRHSDIPFAGTFVDRNHEGPPFDDFGLPFDEFHGGKPFGLNDDEVLYDVDYNDGPDLWYDDFMATQDDDPYYDFGHEAELDAARNGYDRLAFTCGSEQNHQLYDTHCIALHSAVM
jgi:hypothetical protein